MLMTRLEELLKNDTSGQYREQILGQLHHQELEINRILQRGCKPAEYQKWMARKQAMASAVSIINQVAGQLAD